MKLQNTAKLPLLFASVIQRITRQKRKNALRDTKQEVLRLERFQTYNAAINRIISEFFSFRLGVVAQRKAEVNGKKILA